jgi:hypothetical protein
MARERRLADLTGCRVVDGTRAEARCARRNRF